MTNRQEPRSLGIRPPSIPEMVAAGTLKLPTFKGGPAPPMIDTSPITPSTPWPRRPGWV